MTILEPGESTRFFSVKIGFLVIQNPHFFKPVPVNIPVAPFGSPGQVRRTVERAAGAFRRTCPSWLLLSGVPFTQSLYSPPRRIALWLRRASPGPWWSTEKAFWTRSSRLLTKAEALGSIGYKSTVDVDDGSTGGNRLEAVSRPRTAGCSETPDRGGQS